MNVNFAELSRQYEKYQQEYETAVLKTLRSGWYVLGSELERFEKSYAEYEGVNNCIGVGNGLDALRLALSALGIGKGDEVIVQTNTFIATALAITQNGATPVFVEADEYYGIDVNSIEKAITEKTKAIIAVQLYGQMCDMDKVMEIAKKHGLYVVEDCAQCHGATYKGRKAGTIGDVGCFSFYPMKPIGAFGDAGAVVTNNDDIAQKVKMLRNYGSRIKYKHEMLGVNSRLDEIQASVLMVNLKHVEENNNERKRIANRYLNEINNSKVLLPQLRNGNTHVYHIFAIRCDKRDDLYDYLTKAGIQVQIHYPISCHLAPCYEDMGYKQGALPIAEKYAQTEISLPIYVGLTEEEISYIIDTINNY